MEIVQAVKKLLSSISRERLNFRRRPIDFVYNPIQASNFGGTFDQLFLWIFYAIFTKDAPLLLLYHGAKKSKMTKLKSIAKGRGSFSLFFFLERWLSVGLWFPPWLQGCLSDFFFACNSTLPSPQSSSSSLQRCHRLLLEKTFLRRRTFRLDRSSTCMYMYIGCEAPSFFLE